MSQADPKPGRWLLPLVVAGIVAFTWVFVNALPPAPAETTTTTTIAAATTTTASPQTTTSTTLDPNDAAFLITADTVAQAGADLATEAQEINDVWDAGGSYSAALASLEDLEERTLEYATAVSETEVPEAVTEPWAAVIASADAMAVAGTDMVAGLKSSDQGQARATALEDYLEAASELESSINAARAVVTG